MNWQRETRSVKSKPARRVSTLVSALVLGMPVAMLGGCTAMLLGNDVQPVQSQDETEEEDKARSRR